MDSLSKLFGSVARVKIMRLFLLNSETVFTKLDIKSKSQVTSEMLAKELARLKSVGLIRQKSFLEKVTQKTKVKVKKGAKVKKAIVKKKRVNGWQLDGAFLYLDALRSLLTDKESLGKGTLVKRFKNVGKIKLLIVSGAFIQDDQSRVDILIVGDALKKNSFSSALRTLESEIGCELRYAFFKTDDFLYRLGLYDKFIRDILDYPHEKLINKLNI